MRGWMKNFSTYGIWKKFSSKLQIGLELSSFNLLYDN